MVWWMSSFVFSDTTQGPRAACGILKSRCIEMLHLALPCEALYLIQYILIKTKTTSHESPKAPYHIQYIGTIYDTVHTPKAPYLIQHILTQVTSLPLLKSPTNWATSLRTPTPSGSWATRPSQASKWRRPHHLTTPA